MLTHARMRSSNPARRQGVVVFLQKRLAVIYPLYALGLLLALLVQWWRGRALPSWWATLSQGLLAQSWLPWLPEQALLYLPLSPCISMYLPKSLLLEQAQQLHCSANPQP